MNKYEPASVGLLARTLVARLERSSMQLATEVQFKCEVCRDIGRINVDGRSKKCTSCSETKEKKQDFF